MYSLLALFILAIVTGGVALGALAAWARKRNRAYGTKPIRRNKNLLMDVWLDAKQIGSWEENFFGPLPILLERIGKGLALLVSLLVLGLALFVVVMFVWKECHS
jgi:hypothetical protein